MLTPFNREFPCSTEWIGNKKTGRCEKSEEIAVKVLIVDSHPIVRESLVSALSPYRDLQLKGSDYQSDILLPIVVEWHPDVILLNASNSRHRVTECLEALATLRLRPKVVVLSEFSDDNFILNCLRQQVAGFLLDDLSVESLYRYMQTIYEGGAVLSPSVTKLLIHQFSILAQTGFTGGSKDYGKGKLSQTEETIVDWVVRGASNKQIANELFLSEGTVRNYLSDIFAKLGVKGRTQLAIWAVSQGKAGNHDIT